jgi:hypothetical protein
VNTRHTLPGWPASASALSQQIRAREVAALCQATTRNADIYPNGYMLLTQRIVSRARIKSDHSNDHKYFNTIQEQDVWPAGCMHRRTSSRGAVALEPGD